MSKKVPANHWRPDLRYEEGEGRNVIKVTSVITFDRKCNKHLNYAKTEVTTKSGQDSVK